jgi:hypothetical protein
MSGKGFNSFTKQELQPRAIQKERASTNLEITIASARNMLPFLASTTCIIVYIVNAVQLQY